MIPQKIVKHLVYIRAVNREIPKLETRDFLKLAPFVIPKNIIIYNIIIIIP